MNREELLDLKDDWDGYNSPAPNELSISNLFNFLPLLDSIDLYKSIGPSPDGGTWVSVFIPDRNGFKYYMDAYFGNDGNICIICYRYEVETRLSKSEFIWEGEVNDGSLSQAAKDMTDFYNKYKS